MDFTVGTKPKACDAETLVEVDGREVSIKWRYTVLPARGEKLGKAIVGLGITSLIEVQRNPASPEAVAYIKAAARGFLAEVVSAESSEGPVTLNGKPATDPTVRGLVLDVFSAFANHAGNDALEYGQKLDGERGNSPTAPASPANTVSQSGTSVAVIKRKRGKPAPVGSPN